MIMPGQPASQSIHDTYKGKGVGWLLFVFMFHCFYRKTIYDRSSSRKSTHIQNDKVKTKQQ